MAKASLITICFRSVAEAADAFGKKKKWSLSIAIVNEEGNLVYFQRGDKAYSGSIDSAIEKAKSANAFQRPTSAFVSAIKDGRIGLLSVRGIVALEGGVPLTFEGKHIGAIGVSGARSVADEEAAHAGTQTLSK